MISIVYYNMGNVHSVASAFTHLGAEVRIITNPSEIIESEKLVLPGVGSFAKAMLNIRENNFYEPLQEAVKKRKIPILGICLGMQLLADCGAEGGETKGLGLICGKVRKFSILENAQYKIPHIGFNTVEFQNNSQIFSHMPETADFYFVHSYVMDCVNASVIKGWTNYGEKFVSAVQDKHVWGTQFHPEKSQRNGLAVLKNFIEFQSYG